jgi:hypothetical protein
LSSARRHASVTEQPIDLFDRRLGDQPTRCGQSLSDQGNRERRSRHHAERAIGQRQDVLGVQIAAEHSAQKFMNEINSFHRRAHDSPCQLILHLAARENQKFRLFGVTQKWGDS